MSDIIGLWLNEIPESIMSNDDSLRELSGVILAGYRAKKMVVAGSALLITMMSSHCLPNSALKTVASNLKQFLDQKRIPNDEVNAITLTSYDDVQKWEAIKEQITAAVDSQRDGWHSKPLDQWTVGEALQWLVDNKLGQYRNAFKENDMDGQNIQEINEADLRDLGIKSIGHRKTFMRLLAEAKKFTYEAEEVVSEGLPPPPAYQSVSNPVNELEQSKEKGYKSIIVGGLPKSLLQDEDTLFDIENLAFTGFSLNSFTVKDDGILLTFDNPVTVTKKQELTQTFTEVMKRLMLDSQLKGSPTFDFLEDGEIVKLEAEPPKVIDEEPKPVDTQPPEQKDSPPVSNVTPPVKRTNYWEEFWVKLITNGDAEDFFDDEETRLNARGAREVLATIRDVKLKEIKKDDPGIKHLKGFTQAEIEASLSNCVYDVVYEIENKMPPAESGPPKEESPPLDKADKGVYVGMSVEGLPRTITDDDNTVQDIQCLVFKDVPVQRMIIMDDKNPPALKVEFEKYITKEKIPQLARNLKNFLKAVNVDQKALNDITIAFIEEGWQPQPEPAPKRTDNVHSHIRKKTDDFLVGPDDSVEMTRTFMIEGIPERYLNQESFLQDMPEKVFDGVPLKGISVPPASMQPDGTMSQTSLEIRFKEPLNIQRLPKIAMKLKKFLKRKQIPPRIVNQVTLQVRHEETGPPLNELEANPIVGLIFKGIPKKILASNDSLYEMESDVFTNKHPIRLMEPNEADQMLRITIENPIHKQQDLTTIAQRLKRFLARQGVSPKSINDVLVMSFNKEKWQQDHPGENPPAFNPNDYVGIEIENMPASIVDSDKQLEEIERKVFAKQKVVHMNVLDTSLKITFGVAADSKAIEKVARQLKQFLSQMNIPINQINDIIIAPHTAETWQQS